MLTTIDFIFGIVGFVGAINYFSFAYRWLVLEFELPNTEFEKWSRIEELENLLFNKVKNDTVIKIKSLKKTMPNQ